MHLNCSILLKGFNPESAQEKSESALNPPTTLSYKPSSFGGKKKKKEEIVKNHLTSFEKFQAAGIELQAQNNKFSELEQRFLEISV